MQLPTYFDKLVVARVQEILPALQMPSIRIESLRSAARYTYHASLRLEGAIRTPRTYDEPVLDLRAVEPNNISHLMFDAIPYCLRARADRRTRHGISVPEDSASIHRVVGDIRYRPAL